MPDDDEQSGSELAEALIRLCPHLSPAVEVIDNLAIGATAVTLH